MNYGFIKVAAAVPSVKVADCKYNIEQIEQQIIMAEGQGVEIIVFPELSITGYTCQDLFGQTLLLETAENAMLMLLDFTRQLNIIAIVGLPISSGDLLLNCAAVIQKGQILGIIAKEYLPNYKEFYEKRWFASSQDLRTTVLRYAGNQVTITSSPQIFSTCDGVRFGVEICEDVWAPTPPSNHLALAGADIIFNLSASDELIGKHDYLCSLLAQQSARTITGYVYSSAGFGESSQDVVYGGNALIYENGQLLKCGSRFSTNAQIQISQIDVERLRTERRINTTFVNAQRRMIGEEVLYRDAHSISPKEFSIEREIDPHPFIPSLTMLNYSCEEILNIQVMGLVKRIVHTACKRVVIGISGGLDSTLALLICVKAFEKLSLDYSGIIGITMPGFGTTDRTYTNALEVMKALNVTIREINIIKSVTQHFADIGHNIELHDTVYENSQARERTQILMDISNQVGGLVIGTGDLSELALGWCTYNGDHMSMYAVNSSIPKTLVACMVKHIAKSMNPKIEAILNDILDTPISPELVPADENGNIKQKTEDLVGPYELHDFFLYYYIRHGFRPAKIYILAQKAFAGKYNDDTIKHWLKTFFKRFFTQQFKRSCLPDGPKVGSISLSPRGDWRMPSDASAELWIKECESL